MSRKFRYRVLEDRGVDLARERGGVGASSNFPPLVAIVDQDAESLYSTLEKEIVPLYYDRDADGVPRGWVAMMKENLKTIGPMFNSDRMVEEYAAKIYAP